MALGSAQLLTEMSTRRPVRKADNLPPSCAIVTKSGNLNFLERSGPLRPCKGTALALPFISTKFIQEQMHSLLMEASRCSCKRNIILNSVRQHNYFITQGTYIGYMFRL